jgi:hypothetical protein
MDCKKIFNIINIIFFIIFLSIIFTGNAFTCYNSIRNGITGSNYEINKDVFYISKNILTLPIIIIIYFFLNNTKINEDKINFNKVKTSSFLNFLIKNTDLIPYEDSIPFLYLFNISSITVVLCPVIMILLLVPFYILKYLTLSFNIKTYSNILIGLFSFYLLLEILLYFDLSDQNNLFSKTIKLFYFLTIIILLIIISIYTYLVENEHNLTNIQQKKNPIAEKKQQRGNNIKKKLQSKLSSLLKKNSETLDKVSKQNKSKTPNVVLNKEEVQSVQTVQTVQPITPIQAVTSPIVNTNVVIGSEASEKNNLTQLPSASLVSQEIPQNQIISINNHETRPLNQPSNSASNVKPENPTIDKLVTPNNSRKPNPTSETINNSKKNNPTSKTTTQTINKNTKNTKNTKNPKNIKNPKNTKNNKIM